MSLLLEHHESLGHEALDLPAISVYLGMAGYVVLADD